MEAIVIHLAGQRRPGWLGRLRRRSGQRRDRRGRGADPQQLRPGQLHRDTAGGCLTPGGKPRAILWAPSISHWACIGHEARSDTHQPGLNCCFTGARYWD